MGREKTTCLGRIDRIMLEAVHPARSSVAAQGGRDHGAEAAAALQQDPGLVIAELSYQHLQEVGRCSPAA
jgi:hypothetical protein